MKPDIHDLTPTMEERSFIAGFPFKPSFPTKKKKNPHDSLSADAPASSSRINPDPWKEIFMEHHTHDLKIR